MGPQRGRSCFVDERPQSGRAGEVRRGPSTCALMVCSGQGRRIAAQSEASSGAIKTSGSLRSATLTSAEASR